MSEKRHEGPIYSKPKTRKIVSGESAKNNLSHSSKRGSSKKVIAKNSKKLSNYKVNKTKQKKKLTKKRFHAFMTVFLSFFSILVLLWIIFLSPVFALSGKNITISGTSKYISKEQVLGGLKNYIGTPITMININDIENHLYNLNGISSVEIERLWTNGLFVKITPSIPLACEKNDKKFRLVDKMNKTVQMLDKKAAFPEIIVKSKENQLAEPFILQALSNMSEDFRKNIISIEATTFDNIKSKLASGQTIIWGSNENISKKESIVKKILENNQLLAGRKTIDISATYKPIIK
ncbi:MAG: FtsQ-type POTRA domain-containing protein [Bifidobacteriaceae bacterium]|jgi:cell division protein FtsQ|nr:FtsQ-type POTRA domain-containing protein [Bifidobacteriaceae bacterium]